MTLIIMLLVIDILAFEVAIINYNLKQSALQRNITIKQNEYKEDIEILLTAFYSSLISIDNDDEDDFIENRLVELQQNRVKLVYNPSTKYIKVTYPYERDYREDFYMIKAYNDKIKFVKFFTQYF